jgi:small subunit ribosomal protein S3e
MAEQQSISKKKKFVADGVFNAEVHELLGKFLNAAGYSGCVIKNVSNKIIMNAKVVNKQEALGKNGVRGNELEALIEKRFNFKKGHIEVKFEVIKNKSLSAAVQVELLKAKLLQGAPTRSAAMFIIRNVMRVKECKGCEIIVSGKLRQQRAKTVKYKQGYQISTGNPKNEFIDSAIRHVFFKMGIMGIKVKIMLPTDFSGKIGGVAKYLPDKIIIKDPKLTDEEKVDERRN